MSFVHQALNSVTKCELTKCSVFPTWPITIGFLGDSLVLCSSQIRHGCFKGDVACSCLNNWRPHPYSECSVVSLSQFQRRAVERSTGVGQG